MNKTILLGHGSGGKLTTDLIKNSLTVHYTNTLLEKFGDSAVFPLKCDNLAFTTDSYVVDPIFFPGGDIGKLAVCGTVNDLAVSGAKPCVMSVSFIIEEGFSLDNLNRISRSIGDAAKEAEIKIVTGDTKVVNKGSCDKLFINTSGIGVLDNKQKTISSGEDINPGDVLIVNGYLGDHEMAVLNARKNLEYETNVVSDAAPLNKLVEKAIQAGTVKFMRDLTRGGLATVLAEITEKKTYGVQIKELRLPVREQVRGMCEIFGFDPLYMANEGKVLFVVDKDSSDDIMRALQTNKYGKNSTLIGEITTQYKGKAVLESITGGTRILEKLSGEQLPRIC